MRRVATQLFIVASLVAIVGWSPMWPDTLFAPNPRRTNIALQAEVTYEDGSRSRWDLLWTDEPLGPLARYRRVRYRAWALDHVLADANGAIRRDTARFIARLSSTEPWNPVRSVAFLRRTQRITIQPLVSGNVGATEPVRLTRFYTYRAAPP